MSKAERDVVRSKRLALAKVQWRVLRAQRELEAYQASQRAGIAQHDKLKKGAIQGGRLKRADEWGVFEAFDEIDKHLGCRFLDFFRLVDVLQDGSIPVDDLFSALKVAGIDMDDDVLKKVLGALDIDNDGSISYRELSLRMVEQTVRKLALNNGSIVDWNGTTSPAKRRQAIAARTMAPSYQVSAEERHEAAIQILEDEEATKAETLGNFFRKARWNNVKSKIVKVQRAREEDETRRASLRAKRQRRGSTTPSHAARLAKVSAARLPLSISTNPSHHLTRSPNMLFCSHSIGRKWQSARRSDEPQRRRAPECRISALPLRAKTLLLLESYCPLTCTSASATYALSRSCTHPQYLRIFSTRRTSRQ